MASLDMGGPGLLDASDYGGVETEVSGNDESLTCLLSDDTRIVWQTIQLPFGASHSYAAG